MEITDEEAKAIAKTGGIVGIRYIVHVTPYKMLVDEFEYLAKLIGPEHIGVGWLGHDKANFIKMLSERGFTDEQIGMMLGGNYLRVWQQILPSA